MASVIRFKDIYNRVPNEDGTPLSFKDMYTVEYRPGEDELTNYRAKKRKNGAMNEEVQSNILEEMDPRDHVSKSKKNPDMFCVFDKDGNEVKLFKDKKDAEEYAIKNHDALMGEDIDEALTIQQRMKKSRMMKRLKARIKIGRQRARRKMADKKKLTKRANRQARDKVVRKITKDIPKKELSFARKQEIEKRLDRPAFKQRIQRLAKRMLPSIRRAEMQRKKR